MEVAENESASETVTELVDELLKEDLKDDDKALLKAVKFVDEQQRTARLPLGDREAVSGLAGVLAVDRRLPADARRVAERISEVVLSELLEDEPV